MKLSGTSLEVAVVLARRCKQRLPEVPYLLPLVGLSFEESHLNIISSLVCVALIVRRM
jgi:hypothetical protein